MPKIVQCYDDINREMYRLSKFLLTVNKAVGRARTSGLKVESNCLIQTAFVHLSTSTSRTKQFREDPGKQVQCYSKTGGVTLRN